MTTILATKSESGDPLSGVTKYRQRSVLEGEQIFNAAITESTGQSKVERRAAIDEVCDQFRDRLVLVDEKAVLV